jgi:RNA polymerase sigma factor (sigma-70 family)
MAVEVPLQTDEDLVIHYQRTNDKRAVGELFKRHSLMCFAVCMKYLKNEDTAHDATMNIFEKLFTDLQQHSVTNVKSWLHSVCRNHCLMQLRKPNVTISINNDPEENEPFFMQLHSLLHQEDTTADREHTLQQLEKAIADLKDRQRECIQLFYLKQKSYEEIAAASGYSVSEVKSYIQNGKRNLKIALSQQGIGLALALILWIQQSA